MNNYVRDTFFAAVQGRVIGEESTSIRLSTEQAYQHDWFRFSQWCLDNDQDELPAHPKTLSLFLKSEQDAGAGTATLNRRVAAISYMHRNADLPSPLAHDEAQLIREVLTRPKARPRRGVQKPSIRLWRDVLEAIPASDLEGLRDRALLSLHVSAAFRLAELARLSAGQVRFDRSSAQIHLGRFRSHTARGASAITLTDDTHLVPVSRLRRWMAASEAADGALFLCCDGDRVTGQPLSEDEIAAIMAARVTATGYLAKGVKSGLFQVEEGAPGGARSEDLSS